MSMVIPMDEWYPQAQRLLIGGRTSARGDHACGDPGSLMISRDGAEFTAYCFRCGGVGKFKEREDPAARFERLRREAQEAEFLRKSVEPPEPTSYDPSKWPEKDALWFYRMGLSPSRIKELGLYYNAQSARVVLPIREVDQVVFWMARSQTATPKWIGPSVKKRGLFAKYGGDRGKHVVLTEDPLSAYKIGLTCMAWSLLGTKIHSRHVLQLLELDRPVVVWLDDDHDHYSGVNQGQKAAREVAEVLRGAGLTVINQTSPRDPKYYSRYQLQEYMKWHDRSD